MTKFFIVFGISAGILFLFGFLISKLKKRISNDVTIYMDAQELANLLVMAIDMHWQDLSDDHVLRAIDAYNTKIATRHDVISDFKTAYEEVCKTNPNFIKSIIHHGFRLRTHGNTISVQPHYAPVPQPAENS